MLSLPAAFISNFAQPAVFVVRMTVQYTGLTQYLYLSNLPMGSVVLKYGGVNVAEMIHTEYLAAKIANGQGQEESVSGLAEVDASVSIQQGGTSMALIETSITLLNQGDFGGYSYGIENQPIEIYEGRMPASGSLDLLTDCIPRFKGNSRNSGARDSTRWAMTCVDRRLVDAKYMPAKFVNQNTFPHADPGAMGKFIPFVFGDFQTPNTTRMAAPGETIIGSASPLYPYGYGILSAVPSILADIYQNQAFISDDVFSISGPVYVTDDSSKYIAIILQTGAGTPPTGYTVLAAGGGVPAKIVCNPGWGEIWLIPSAQGYNSDDLLHTPPGGSRASGTNAVIDIGNAIDGDPLTYVEINDTHDVAPFLQVKLPSFTEPGDLVPRIDPIYGYGNNGATQPQDTDFFVGGVFEFAGGADGVASGHGDAGFGDFGLTVYDTSYPSTLYKDFWFSGTAGQTFLQEWPVEGWTLNSSGNNAALAAMTWPLMKSRIGIVLWNANNVAGTGERKLRIHHLYIRARTRFQNTGLRRTVATTPVYAYTPSLVLPLFAGRSMTIPGHTDITGYRFEMRGSGISNLFVPAKGVTYTSAMTRSNGHTTSDVIHEPAGAIEYLLRYRLGLPTSAIDTASFDIVGNTTNGLRKDWKIDVSIIEKKPVLDYAAIICQEFGLILVVTSSGQYRLVALDNVSSAYTIQPSDVAWDDTKGPRIEVDFTPNDAILNDFTVQYGFDYTRSKNLQSVYISDVNNDGSLENNLLSNTGSPRGGAYDAWLIDSIGRYGANRQLNISSMMIQDTATANLSLKKQADWLAFKRMIARIDLVKNLDTIRLEVGDTILINLDQVTATNQNVTPFLITRVRKAPIQVEDGENIVTIECEEIPNANTGIPGTSLLEFFDSGPNAFVDGSGNLVYVRK